METISFVRNYRGKTSNFEADIEEIVINNEKIYSVKGIYRDGTRFLNSTNFIDLAYSAFLEKKIKNFSIGYRRIVNMSECSNIVAVVTIVNTNHPSHRNFYYKIDKSLDFTDEEKVFLLNFHSQKGPILTREDVKSIFRTYSEKVGEALEGIRYMMGILAYCGMYNFHESYIKHLFKNINFPEYKRKSYIKNRVLGIKGMK